jgi:hypothetical protein
LGDKECGQNFGGKPLGKNTKKWLRERGFEDGRRIEHYL